MGASPDGAHIVYSSVYTKPGAPAGQSPLLRIHVMNADGTGDHIVTVLDADYEDWPLYSPDGTRLGVVTRTGGQHRVAIVPADEKGPVVASDGVDDSSGHG